MFEWKPRGYTAEEILRRNAQSFTETGTFCATCGAFGLGRHPQTKQHGVRNDWESFTVPRRAADAFARATDNHPMRRDRDMITTLETNGDVTLFQLCQECAVKEGVGTQDPTIN